MVFIFTANKKAKLINGTSSTQHLTINNNQTLSSSTSVIIDEQNHNNYIHIDRTNLTTSPRPGGPNLVNKQLVLPFVPPSFPNGTSDGANHLIKPSEYLKSIIDKRSSASSVRYLFYFLPIFIRYTYIISIYFFYINYNYI